MKDLGAELRLLLRTHSQDARRSDPVERGIRFLEARLVEDERHALPAGGAEQVRQGDARVDGRQSDDAVDGVRQVVWITARQHGRQNQIQMARRRDGDDAGKTQGGGTRRSAARQQRRLAAL